MSFLFKDIIFGPISSRRLGRSLGINILPLEYKLCSFNCIYCECGWTEKPDRKASLPERQIVMDALEDRLQSMIRNGDLPDAITFAGNGEPTLHPEFASIANDTLTLRDKYSPASRLVILSNATTLHRPDILDALSRFDLSILKLDCGTEEMYHQMNKPVSQLSLDTITKQLEAFRGKLIIQTLFTRGKHDGKEIDNTRPDEIKAWMDRIVRINPERVMIYSLDREPPELSLEKISHKELEQIGQKLKLKGIKADIY